MATFDYAPLQARTAELIEKFGSAILITRVGSTDDWTRKFDETVSRTYWEDGDGRIVYTAPTGTEIEVPGHAIVTKWPLDLIEDGSVEVGDVRILVVTTADVEIHNGDVIVFASTREYQVLPPINRIMPDGVTLFLQEVNGRG